ncbi:MAG TPA: maleate cis-trans isomerase [Streptosporangiaceae bacterium]|jgi:maleate cis-trans isomerase
MGEARVSVGFLYPGHSAEDDYPRAAEMLGDVDLPLVHTRMESDAHVVEQLLKWGEADALADGARDIPDADVVVWACTSGSFVHGWDGAHRQVAALAEAAGRPATSTSVAFARAARALGLRRVAVAATYPPDVAALFTAFMADAGVEVVQTIEADILLAGDVGLLGREDVLRLAESGDHADAEAVLLPDTALHSVAWLDDLEKALGKPVLTANQVSIWEGLRLAGATRPRDGLGKLFRDGFRAEVEQGTATRP